MATKKKTTRLQGRKKVFVRMGDELKARASDLAQGLGMTTSSLVTLSTALTVERLHSFLGNRPTKLDRERVAELCSLLGLDPPSGSA